MKSLVRFLIGLSILLLIGNIIFFFYNLFVISWGSAFVIFYLVDLGIALLASIALLLSKKLKSKDSIGV